jgi:hypothetical protein
VSNDFKTKTLQAALERVYSSDGDAAPAVREEA